MSDVVNHEVVEGQEFWSVDEEDQRKTPADTRTKVALVYGTVPSHEELEQYSMYCDSCEFTLVTAVSIADYIQEVSFFKGLNIIALPDHDENPTFLPGLEKELASFDVVIVKERVGLYAYQAVKSKWINNFKMYVVVDNVTPFPGEDIAQMKTIREEVTSAADGIIVQSKIVQNMLTTVEGISKDRVLYFAPYVECRRSPQQKDRIKALEMLGLHDGDFVISAIGQIEWEEGLLDVIHALKHVHEREGEYCKVKLVICGVGSFDQDVLGRAQSLGISHAVKVVDPSRLATKTVLDASNLMFASAVQSRDRLEGDPFKVLLAIANGLPLLSGRTPIVEEIIGKHRVDFCIASPRSIADAVIRAKEAKSLVSNIKSKNLSLVNSEFNAELANEDYTALMEHSATVQDRVENRHIARQINEVENLVNKKQYLDAIAMVERLFGEENLQIHHRANLYRLIGDSFAKLQDNVSAKESYAHALELDPFLSKAYLGQGVVKIGEANYSGAILDFQKSVSYSPKDEMASLGLGLAFQGLGEPDEARSWMISSLKIAPTNEMAIFSLLQLCNDTDNYKGCEDALKAYLIRKPNQPDIAYTYASILYKQGKVTEARDKCEKMLAIMPTDKKIRELYEMVLEDEKAGSTNRSISKLG